MPSKEAVKTISYKAARFVGSRHELAAQLSVALRAAPLIGDRLQSLGHEDAQEFLVINETRDRAGFVSGCLLKYAPGAAAAALLSDPSVAVAPITKFAPPGDGAARQEWLDSALYFTAYRNHVAVLQSAALRSMALESHLRWFLGAVPATATVGSVELNDKPARATAARLRQVAVRNIQLGGSLLRPTQAPDAANAAPPAAERSPRRSAARSVTVAGEAGADNQGALSALSALVGVREFSRLNLAGMDDSQVSYKLVLTIDHRKSGEDHSQDTLNKLGNALRNAEGVDAKITLMDGSTVSGDELRLTGKQPLMLYDGFPDTADVFDKLTHWLQSKMESGDIEAQ